MKQAPWQDSINTPFAEADQETDPLTGFANIMDVMLVFALGLMLALIAQSSQLREHFNLAATTSKSKSTSVHAGKELHNIPESMQNSQGQMQGFESLGQVYKDPKTGKLILVGGQ